MHHFLIALLLCLSLAPWEALGQPADAVGADRDAMLAPSAVASLPPGAALVTSPPVVAGVPPGYTLVRTQPTPEAVPTMPEAVVDEVPTPPPSIAAEPWWLPLIQNAHLWAIALTAIIGLLKLLGVKKVDRYARDFAEVVQIAFLATEEAGLLGELPKGGKTGAFSELFEGLMGERGHTDLSTTARGAALAEAKALNAAARVRAPVVDPMPAPSAP